MHPRCEADDEERGRGVAERGYRLAEIAGMLLSHGIEKSRQARAAPAIGIVNAVHVERAGLKVALLP
jgi:hypothetical protein